MIRNTGDLPHLRDRRSGVRIFSASLVGVTALVAIGGFMLMRVDADHTPVIGGVAKALQAKFETPIEARLENPLPPQDVARTEAARVDAEKRIAEAIALQFSSLPSAMRPALSTNAPAGQTSADMSAEPTSTAVLPEPPKAALPAPTSTASDETQAGGVTQVARTTQVQRQVAGAGTAQTTTASAATAPDLAPLPVSTMPPEEQDALMARVEGLLRQGDVGASRAILKRLVRENNAIAAFALAQSYDPQALKRSGFVVQGDEELARKLYAQALEGGVSEAGTALAQLQAGAR